MISSIYLWYVGGYSLINKMKHLEKWKIDCQTLALRFYQSIPPLHPPSSIYGAIERGLTAIPSPPWGI